MTVQEPKAVGPQLIKGKMIQLQRKAALLHIMAFYYALIEVLSNFGLCSGFGRKLINVIEINAGIFDVYMEP